MYKFLIAFFAAALLIAGCGSNETDNPEIADRSDDTVSVKAKPFLIARTNRFFEPDTVYTLFFNTDENPAARYQSGVNLELEMAREGIDRMDMQKDLYVLAYAEGGDILGMRLTNNSGIMEAWVGAKLYLTFGNYYRIIRNSVEGGPKNVYMYFVFEGNHYHLTIPQNQDIIDSGVVATPLEVTEKRLDVTGTPVPITDPFYNQLDLPLPIQRRAGKQFLSYFYWRAEDGATLVNNGSHEPTALSKPIREQLSSIGITPDIKFKTVNLTPKEPGAE